MPDQPAARLLVVDDEPLVMGALCNTLRDEGYEAFGAASGEEALTRLAAERFDLVLTDLMLPKMDGVELLARARELDPQLVGIVMTGHGTIPTAVDAMKAGAIDYVQKPFKLGTLRPALERGLTLRRLRVKNAQLEERVHERTAELEFVNKELEAFAYSVSHDLRTPLRAVRGFAELLVGRADGFSAEDRRCLEMVHRGACEMDQLIDSLLAFSRVGHKAPERRPIDLERLARDVFEDLSGDRRGRAVEFTVRSLPAASGDPVLVRQVLVNLIANALKFTRPRDPARVEVGATAPAGGGAVVYFVRDNGVGFDMKHADRLFGVFQRLYHAQEFEGTGVGLAMVRRIVERHGGQIWAEAAEDKGATFFFTLPPDGR